MVMDKITFTADYETIDRNGVESVWLWDVCNMLTFKHDNGIDIESFIQFVDNIKWSCNIYFHNLKFDGSFLIDHLLKNGYEFTNKKSLKIGEFTTLITEFGQFLSITYKNKCNKNITFIDSLKIIPLSIKKIAEDFKLKIQKGEIDYKKPRPVGYIPTKEEYSYINNDTEIAAQALKKMLDEGHNRITISSCAFADYQKIVGKKYKTWFGEWEKACNLDLDNFIRQAYRGGFCQSNKKYLNSTLKQPVFYNDVNSLYPYVMRDYDLPYGSPVYFNGKYIQDDEMPYYVQRIKIDMRVKDDGIPCILYNQNRVKSMYIVDTLEQSDAGGCYEMTVTNFDLKLIYKNYDIFHLEFLDGYKFRIRNDMFKEYVDKHIKIKEEATKVGNGALRTISKLLLNSLYGKFGQNPQRRKKLPYVGEDNKIKFEKSELETVNKFKYLPVAVFITAIARYKIITDILKIGIDNWVYSDTDSILSLVPLEKEMVDDVKLGKYKVEYLFKKTRVLGQKSYYGVTSNKKSVIRVCGCSRDATKGFPIGLFNYFTENGYGGIIKGGRTTLKTVNGGKRLDFGDFQIKDKQVIHLSREQTIEDIKKVLDSCLDRNKKKILKNTLNKNIVKLLQLLTLIGENKKCQKY